jgi:hypothetical protein
MKIILSSRRYHYLARLSVVLVIVVLIGGMVGCDLVQYNLTISSTLGGTVITPGVGNFTYDEGTVVNLTVEPTEGYSFFNWSGNVSTIADVNSPATTITMNGHYFITANFFHGQLIRTWYDLDDIRDDLGDSYILMNDLDSNAPGYEELASPTTNGGKGWQPIGTYDDPFTGSFDGQVYDIRDLFINRPDEDCVGLFSTTGDGVIEDIGVVNADVTGKWCTGGLVGVNRGIVNNSYSTGSVTGSAHVSGLVGANVGEVSNSYSTSSVTGDSYVGGLVGTNSGTVSNSYSTGSVTGDGYVGGLVGINYEATISNSYSTGSVTGDYYFVGGLVGANSGTVSNSYSTGSVTGDAVVGGLVGDNSGTVSSSYSTGSVTGDEYVGGLVGWNVEGTVSNSFWDTVTSGQATSQGGTGKTTVQMKNITNFSGATWDIIIVADPATRNPSYTWNIVDGGTYPFLSWEP